NFPNVQKGDDGKYHILHVNNGESNWDTGDTPNEISGMKLAFTNAIAVSTILGVDEDLRSKWKDILDNLAQPGNPGRGRRPATPTGGDAGAAGGAAPTTRRGDGNGGATAQGGGGGGDG